MKPDTVAHMHKALHPESLPPLDKTAALSIINTLAHEPVEEADIYVGRARLANDQMDLSGERFPVDYLKRFAETLPGRPVLLGHDKSSIPVGRWFAAQVSKDTQGVNHLVADFYLDSEGEAVRRLKLGIAKDMSIGYLSGARICDLCGGAMDKSHFCEGGHRLNQEYEGKRCTVTYGGDLNRVVALEGSFVGLGCQPGAEIVALKMQEEGAGVVLQVWRTEESPMPDTAALEARVKMLEDENEKLSALQKDAGFITDGKQYRLDLMEEIKRKAAVLEKNVELEVNLLASADLATLKAYDGRLDKELEVKFPPAPHSKMLGGGAEQLPELRGETPPPAASPKEFPGGLRTSPFHMWDEE